MREVTITDVFAAALPRRMDPHDPATADRLDLMSKRLVIDQYERRGIARPIGLRFLPTAWLITTDPAEADAFQPAHECPACLAGADQMRAFLREHPDRYVVLANLTYIEAWPSE